MPRSVPNPRMTLHEKAESLYRFAQATGVELSAEEQTGKPDLDRLYIAIKHSEAGKDSLCGLVHRITENLVAHRADNERLRAENADLKAALTMANKPTIPYPDGTGVHIGFIPRLKERSES
ncbi:MAG: hypothetical protein V4671_22435 [Armatimonadota bacterium]